MEASQAQGIEMFASGYAQVVLLTPSDALTACILQASFKKQLSGILEDVAAEERAKKKLEQAVSQAHDRYNSYQPHAAGVPIE